MDALPYPPPYSLTGIQLPGFGTAFQQINALYWSALHYLDINSPSVQQIEIYIDSIQSTIFPLLKSIEDIINGLDNKQPSLVCWLECIAEAIAGLFNCLVDVLDNIVDEHVFILIHYHLSPR